MRSPFFELRIFPWREFKNTKKRGLLRKNYPNLETDKKTAHASKSYPEHYLTGILKDYLIL